MGVRVTDRLKRARKTLVSFELLPPLKGDTINTIYDTLDSLMEFKPPYINVTYHQEEVQYREVENKLLEKKRVWKRPGTVAISAAIMNKYDVSVVPHLICGGFSKEETENALIDLSFLGIRNVLALRGDAPHGAQSFVPEPDGNKNSIELVKQIRDLNKGVYLDDELVHNEPTDFSIGVAGYPEKHTESPNVGSDIEFLKKKVDAGADYIVTQLFFDNKKYFDFVDRCREAGIDVPIIPGIKPISVKKHLQFLPKIFNIDIPADLVQEVMKCGDNKAVRQVGVEWGIQQAKELKEAGVPVIHFYTMGKPDNVRKIVEQVF